MSNQEIEKIKREIQDLKGLMILFLQNLKIDNETIGKAMGVSPGKVSQLIDKKKYPIRK